MKVLISVTALMLSGVVAGCAGTTHQPVSTGKGTYLIAVHGVMGWSSEGAQKAKALQEAAALCATKGLSFETVSDRGTESGFGKIASAEVEFRCVRSSQ